MTQNYVNFSNSSITPYQAKQQLHNYKKTHKFLKTFLIFS